MYRKSCNLNNLIERMISHASNALQHAYAPYSHYCVGACICCEDDSLHTGVNVENSSYGLTICAESSAICKMASEGKHTIKSIVILAKNNQLCAPCGACRQRIYEFSIPETQIYLCNQQTVLKTTTINELLPLAFHLNPTHRTQP